MAITPEGKVKAKVRALLKEYYIYHFMPATGGYGRSGVPDIVGCVNGEFFAVECKADSTKKLTALQQRELDNIAKAGGSPFVICDDSTLSYFETWLRLRLTSSEE